MRKRAALDVLGGHERSPRAGRSSTLLYGGPAYPVRAPFYLGNCTLGLDVDSAISSGPCRMSIGIAVQTHPSRDSGFRIAPRVHAQFQPVKESMLLKRRKS
jgi:hypothetical protein